MLMRVANSELNAALKKYEENHIHLREFDYGKDNFHLFLGISRQWIDSRKGFLTSFINLTPPAAARMRALINTAPENLYPIIRAAMAQVIEDEQL